MRIKTVIDDTADVRQYRNAKESNHQSVPPSSWLRLLLCLVTVALSGAILYVVGNRLVSQVYYTKAKSAFESNYHWIAVSHLKAAIRYQPDDFMFWRKLAEVYGTIGEQENSIQRAFLYAGQARKAFLESNRLNPLEASTVMGLAKSEARLQQLYPILYPDRPSNPYNPLPYLKSAIKLRPNEIRYHFALARYLHQSGRIHELLQEAQTLGRMFPSGVFGLKNEQLWSSGIQSAIKKGLQEAIDEKSDLKDAHRTLSQMLAAEKNWPEALLHFEKALSYQRDISSEDYTQLGRLRLYNNDVNESIDSFVKAMTLSPDKENRLAAIARIFDSGSHQQEFSQFYSDIEKNFLLSPKMQIIAARKFIDLNQLDRARHVLTAVNDYRPNGDAYYWLARIAEIEKDWDAMEINIQKATVLEPANEHYRYIFMQLRKRLGKDKVSVHRAPHLLCCRALEV